MHPLDIKFSNPLEREYEAWIIQGIENYFHSLGQKVAIWAVSPADEVNWPADEHMIVGKKLIGLQFKKVGFIDNKVRPKDFGRLRWSFHKPQNQYDLVAKFPEIFYCLPTFINRDYRRQAVHHCLFWRTNPKDKRNLNAWYDNPKARTPHKSIGDSPRWGFFIEKVIACKVGKKIDSMKDAKNYVQSIINFWKDPGTIDSEEEMDQEPDQQRMKESEYHVYIIALPYQS